MANISGRPSANLHADKDLPVELICRYLEARYEAHTGSSTVLNGMVTKPMRETLGQALTTERDSYPMLKEALGSVQFVVVELEASAREHMLTLQMIERYRYRTAETKKPRESIGLRRHILDLRNEGGWKAVNHAILPLSPNELQGDKFRRLVETSGEFDVKPRRRRPELPWGKLSLLAVAVVVAVVGMIAWGAPRRQQVDVCLYTGRERYATQLFDFALREGERETDLAIWLAAYGQGTDQELWRPWGGYHKPAFGDKRMISKSREAEEAITLLEAIREASSHSKGRLPEWLGRYRRFIELKEEANQLGTVQGAKAYERAVRLRQQLSKDLQEARLAKSASTQ